MKHVFSLVIFNLLFTISYSQEKAIRLSHYLFPEFSKGVVLMKSGTKYDALLNYNSLTEEMVFEVKGEKKAMGAAELQLVDTIFIKDRKFFRLNSKFVELIYHSTCDLYAEYKCSVTRPGTEAAYGGSSQSSATTSYSSLNSGIKIYDLELPDGFETEPHTYYWLKRNGEVSKFISIKQLMKLYDDKEDLFKAYVKKNNVKFSDQESILELVRYLDAN